MKRKINKEEIEDIKRRKMELDEEVMEMVSDYENMWICDKNYYIDKKIEEKNLNEKIEKYLRIYFIDCQYDTRKFEKIFIENNLEELHYIFKILLIVVYINNLEDKEFTREIFNTLPDESDIQHFKDRYTMILSTCSRNEDYNYSESYIKNMNDKEFIDHMINNEKDYYNTHFDYHFLIEMIKMIIYHNITNNWYMKNPEYIKGFNIYDNICVRIYCSYLILYFGKDMYNITKLYFEEYDNYISTLYLFKIGDEFNQYDKFENVINNGLKTIKNGINSIYIRLGHLYKNYCIYKNTVKFNKLDYYKLSEKYFLLGIEYDKNCYLELAYLYDEKMINFELAEKYYILSIDIGFDENIEESLYYRLSDLYEHEFEYYKYKEFLLKRLNNKKNFYRLAVCCSELKLYKLAEEYYLLSIVYDINISISILAIISYYENKMLLLSTHYLNHIYDILEFKDYWNKYYWSRHHLDWSEDYLKYREKEIQSDIFCWYYKYGIKRDFLNYYKNPIEIYDININYNKIYLFF